MRLPSKTNADGIKKLKLANQEKEQKEKLERITNIIDDENSLA